MAKLEKVGEIYYLFQKLSYTKMTENEQCMPDYCFVERLKVLGV